MNVCSGPISTCRHRQLWVVFCQSGPPSVLVKSDANDLPSRMQMSGQVQCKWVVRLSAITHPRGQPCGVGPIWKGSMRARIQPPSKTGVTGVTSVTLFTKRPVSLAFMPVTQLSDIAYLRCNAATACNAKVSIRVLWAGALRSSLPSEFRGLRLSMRGNHAGDPESFSFTRGMKPAGSS